MVFRVLFDWFFWSYAAAGGLAVAVLATAAGTLAGHPVPVAASLTAALGSAGVFRLALLVYQRDPAVPGALDRLGRLLAGVVFATLAATSALGLTVLGWLLVTRFGTSAEARMLVPLAPGGGVSPGFLLTAATNMAGSVLLVAYGYARGYRALRVREQTVRLAALPATSPGIRLVHLSDLHLGPMADPAVVREAIARVRALDPDVVCVTGDIVDNAAADLDRWIPELAGLTARHGVVAILGNHDRQSGAERVVAALARHTSWRVLRDAATTISVGQTQLHLIGLEDRRGRDARPALAGLLAAAPVATPVVVLAHYPHTFAATAAAGVPLTLAGHTHGGQVALPGFPRVNPARLLMTRHDGGLFVEGGAALHVSRGLGTGCQPLRVGVPPEITLLTLVPAEAAEAA